MIISTHIILTTVVTAPLVAESFSLSNAGALFFVSFLTHYILDAIPHWDYNILSFKEIKSDINKQDERRFIFHNATFFKDAIRTTMDGLLGLGVAFWLVGMPTDLERLFIFFLIATASILPDIIELFYTIWKWLPFSALSKAHRFFHTSYEFKGHFLIGAALQIIIISAVVAVFKFI